MKIVIVSTGKTFNLASVGYSDLDKDRLMFRVMKDNFTMEEIYEAFKEDTSSLKFLYDNNDLAWVKGGYTSLVDFHPMMNQNVGRDTVSNEATYADVVAIELAAADYETRLTNAEDAIKKLTLGSLTTASIVEKAVAEIDAKVKEVDEKLAQLTAPDAPTEPVEEEPPVKEEITPETDHVEQ